MRPAGPGWAVRASLHTEDRQTDPQSLRAAENCRIPRLMSAGSLDRGPLGHSVVTVEVPVPVPWGVGYLQVLWLVFLLEDI